MGNANGSGCDCGQAANGGDQHDHDNHEDHILNHLSDPDDAKILPVEKRRSTDVLCILLLFAAWICMTFIGLTCLGFWESPLLQPGNPERLTHGIDYKVSLLIHDDDNIANSKTTK